MVDATQITYSDSSVPAPAQRTVAAKLSDMVSLLDTDLVTALSTARRIWVPAGTYNITGSITVTADLIMDSGAVFSVASGVTLTIAGHIDAPKRQIFAGAGNVAFIGFNKVHEVYPEWWGVKADNSDSTAAMQACLQAATTSGIRVQFTGLYTMTSGPARVNGPGSLEIAGVGMETSGFLCRNSQGCLVFNGTVNNLDWDQLHIHDFQCTAMDSQGSCGDAIDAYWPKMAGNVLPTLTARNLLVQSETYSSDSSHGRWINGLHIKQANVCRVENFNGIAIGNTTMCHIRIDNSLDVGVAVYECAILKPNVQGGQYGVYTSGEIEELLIEPLGMDTQEFCIWSDGRGGGGGGVNGTGQNNGVITIRGGDLNGHQACVYIMGWINVVVDSVNMGIVRGANEAPSDYNCLFLGGGASVSSLFGAVTGCQLGGPTSKSAAALFINNFYRVAISDNVFGNGSNGLIVDNTNSDSGNNSNVQCALVANNVFTGVSDPTNVNGIFVAAGDRALIVGNQVTGYGTGIAMTGTNGRAQGNQVYGCSLPYNLPAGKGNVADVSSAAQNGYATMPNGLTLQWGLIPGNATDHNVSFPVPFTSACFSVTTQASGNAPSGQVVDALVDQIATTGFAIRPRYTQNNGAGGVASQAIYWMAIGN